MLDKQKHEYYLKRILRDLMEDFKLQSQLGLKGGSCLYLFYGLDRFSVDLDFNLRSPSSGLAVERMEKVLGKYLDLEEGSFREGEAGWLWEASYQKGLRKMQIDVSRRDYGDEYKVSQFYGLSVATMKPEFMFAHKLCAIMDRPQVQNRDLYDSWFMFDNLFEIEERIVEARRGKGLKEYLEELEVFIDKKVDRDSILQGLGELVEEGKKQWVKVKLVDELLGQIKMKADSLQ